MYKILVVDDKPAQVDLMCLMLAKLNAECIVAYSGLEAVELAQQEQPDLILMDWVMPADTLTGFDATQQLLANSITHHIPIIACSALGDLSQALSIGCIDAINKPFDLNVFLEIVQRHLP